MKRTKSLLKFITVLPLIFTASAMVSAVLSFSSCSNKQEDEFEININILKGQDIQFSNTKAKVGKEFFSNVFSTSQIESIEIFVDEKLLVDGKDYTFKSIAGRNFSYTLTIFAESITSNKVSINITSEPPGEKVTITFNAGEGTIGGQHSTTLDVPVNSMWKSVEYPEPQWNDHPFLHWSLSEEGPEVPEEHVFSSSDDVYAVYHTHQFDLLKAHDDKLYWGCSSCSDKILLTDQELEVYADKFLVENNGVLEVCETTNLQEIQAKYSEKSTLDIYIVSGNFELSESYDNSTLNFHGVLNSQNKSDVVIQCGQVVWHGNNTKLSFRNTFMHGGTTAAFLDNGLHCGDLECVNCTFDGYETIWAINTATFTNCIFDSTKQDEYTFYTYGQTRQIDFNQCTFNCFSKAIKVYRQIDIPLTLNIKETTFNIGQAGKADAKSAIEVDSHECIGFLGPDCRWNINVDDATLATIDTTIWDTVCKDRWKEYTPDPIVHYTYSDYVKFNGGPVPGNPPMPDHDHVLGGYQIIDNKVYGVCKDYGDTFELTNEQMNNLKNKVFYRYEGHYGYTLTETEHTDIKDIAAEGVSRKIDIYLIDGDYKLGQSWSDGGYQANVNINGILDYSGNKLTTFDCVKTDGARTDHIYKWHGMNLTFKNVKLLGLTNIQYGNDWQLHGLQPQTMFVENCDVLGCHTTHASGVVKFKNCHFDNTVITGEVGLDDEYCIYTYNGLTDFENCDFVSNGKAIKIYSNELQGLKSCTGTFNLSDCTFTISKQKVYDKHAIEIDSGLQLETNHYQVLIEHCSQTGFVGLWKDKSTKSDVTVIE